jgi:hypothetical protein
MAGRVRSIHHQADFTSSRTAIVKKLRIEDIQVDSYNTHATPAVHGTVQANMATLLRCPTSPFQCPAPTDAASCQSGTFCC